MSWVADFAIIYVFRVLDDIWVDVMHNNRRSQFVSFTLVSHLGFGVGSFEYFNFVYILM